jgi:undecaprenyl pyrophosphate phosphatase UppP
MISYLIKDFLSEGMNLDFKHVSSLRQYFGEKIGFYYAWLCYYTVWMIIPGIAGLGVQLYMQITGNLLDFVPVFYAMFLLLWVTIMVERWKRKVAEIGLKWGVYDIIYTQTREIRPEFYGDEFVNKITGGLDKYSSSLPRIVAFFLSIPTLLFMIGCCITVFVGTLFYKRIQNTITAKVTILYNVLVLGGSDQWSIYHCSELPIQLDCSMVC